MSAELPMVTARQSIKAYPGVQEIWECQLCGGKFLSESLKDIHMTKCFSSAANSKESMKPSTQRKVPIKPPSTPSKNGSFAQFSDSNPQTHKPNYSSEKEYTAILQIQSDYPKHNTVTDVHHHNTHIASSHTAMQQVKEQFNRELPGRNTKQTVQLAPPHISKNVAGSNDRTQDTSPALQIESNYMVFPSQKLAPGAGKKKSQSNNQLSEDEGIYTNLGDFAENLRLKQEIKVSKAENRALVEENKRLKEQLAKCDNVIDNFHTEKGELLEKVRRLESRTRAYMNVEFKANHSNNSIPTSFGEKKK